MYEFWYDYEGKAKLYQIYSLQKTEDIYIDIAKDVETRFDAPNYELERPLSKGKNENVIGLKKDE